MEKHKDASSDRQNSLEKVKGSKELLPRGGTVSMASRVERVTADACVPSTPLSYTVLPTHLARLMAKVSGFLCLVSAASHPVYAADEFPSCAEMIRSPSALPPVVWQSKNSLRWPQATFAA